MSTITIPEGQSIQRAFELVQATQWHPSQARIIGQHQIEVAWLAPAVLILAASGFHSITAVEQRPS